MLLQDLHDSHVCNSLLVAESEEDIWKNESLYRQRLNNSDGKSPKTSTPHFTLVTNWHLPPVRCSHDIFGFICPCFFETSVFEISASTLIQGRRWMEYLPPLTFIFLSSGPRRLQHRRELPGQRLPGSHHAVHSRAFCLRRGMEHNHPHSPTPQDGTQHGGVQRWVANLTAWFYIKKACFYIRADTQNDRKEIYKGELQILYIFLTLFWPLIYSKEIIINT